MEIELLKKENTPENVIEHCKAVYKKSIKISKNFDNVDMDLIKNVYSKGTNSGVEFDKIAVAGTVARAVVKKLDLPLDIEFAAPQATANAARKGLNVLAICVGEMSKAFTRELENEKIKFNIIDGTK